MDKGEAHSKPGIGNLREDSPVLPLASGCDIDQHRKPRLHGSYAPGRTPSRQPPASAPPHGIIHKGPPRLISNLMSIKSAKVCAYHKNFLRGPRMPGRYPLERAELSPLSPNAHRVGKNDRRAAKKFCLGKRSWRIRACQFWGAGQRERGFHGLPVEAVGFVVVMRGAGWQIAHCYGKPPEQPFSQRPNLHVEREPVENSFCHDFN